jgi:hypothetical protein
LLWPVQHVGVGGSRELADGGNVALDIVVDGDRPFR